MINNVDSPSVDLSTIREESDATPSQFTVLPKDVLEYVFRYLNNPELLSFSLLSKHWRTYAEILLRKRFIGISRLLYHTLISQNFTILPI